MDLTFISYLDSTAECRNILKNIKMPLFSPLPESIERPFWSVMIPTYNGTKYLEETLRSVLSQDPGSDLMQIEVIDDFSTEDDPEPLVHEIGQGRIMFTRQSQNQGQIETWNNCIRRARGHWIHILHQDDIVLPGFYSRLQSAVITDQVGGLLCRNIYMDEDGHWQSLSPVERQTPGILENWLELIAASQRVQFPAVVVRRSTYEKLGGFCPAAYSAADWEMWKRIAAHYQIWYEPQPLACFRLHSASESSRLIQTGENIAHTRRAIEITKSYLPDPIAEKLSQQAREYYASYALNTARYLLTKNEIAAATAQIREALACNISLKTIGTIIKILGRSGVEKILNGFKTEVI
jgi:glycosyltransferase involved in cell wall biosynthesis